MPAAKKATSKRTTAAKKTAGSASKKQGAAVKNEARDIVVESVKSGAFDDFLTELDDALTERINKHAAEKRAASRSSEKKGDTREVPQPTRNARSAAEKFDAEVNGTYQVESGLKKVGGCKVKFLRFRKDDNKKAVVEMLVDAPGAPKGSRVVIPIAALRKVARKSASKSAAKKSSKKTAAKRTTKKK